MKKKTQLLLNLTLTIALTVAAFVYCPNLNPLYQDGAFIWCVVLSAYLALNFLVALGGLRLVHSEGGVSMVMDRDTKGYKLGVKLLAVLWALFILASIASSVFFNYGAYRDQLGAPIQSQFTDTVQPLDLDQLPIVDKYLAAELADKKLGENPGLGSQVVLGTPVIQQVNGKLVWVVPLQHSGFFKWFSNMDGSAGYIVVSATDLKDVTLVQDHKIKYQENAYLFDDLTRHVRFLGGGLFTGLVDPSFELDDDGIPYWVITVYKNRWFFRLPEAAGVILVNATTGKTTHYDTEEIPSWIDRVQPESFITQQINNQGEYVHGFLNFSNKDKFRTSPGNIIVYSQGNCYYFTGLTSVGSDEAAMGFMMVDMVTKEAKMYHISGATETAAQASAQGKVQQYGYQASFPMIINLDGRPTYFMTLKDKAGLIKQYALVSVTDYTSVGTGETITSALHNFRQVLGSGSGSIATGSDVHEVQGTVLRIASESLGDTITYKFILAEYPDIIFTAAYDLSNELALTLPGDEAAVSYVDSSSNICAVVSFDNLRFAQLTGQPVSPEPQPELPPVSQSETPDDAPPETPSQSSSSQPAA